MNNNLGRILKQRRMTVPLTLRELSATSGVSASHLGRIERGERFPSARVLRKLAPPLDSDESELLTLAGYLSPKPSAEAETPPGAEQVDPYVASVLSKEPVRIQLAVISILTILKSIAKASVYDLSFAEYVRRKYPQADEDIIIMAQDVLEHPQRAK